MLELAIYPQDTRYVSSGKLIAFWKDSDVFHTIDHAVASGKERLEKKLKSLCREMCGEEWTVETLVKEAVYYDFIVYETDPSIGNKKEDRKQWKYDYNGVFLYGENENGAFFFIGDEDEDAGTKYERGMFVTAEKNLLGGRYFDGEDVWVIMRTPGKKSEWPHLCAWENVYLVEGVDGKGFFTHNHIPERDIRIFDGEIPMGHPLNYLRKCARNENKISDELKHAIAHQKIIFDYPEKIRSWREFPELYDELQN